MNVLHTFIEKILPYMISILEIIGIFVVFWSGIHGFWQYFQNTFMKKKYDLQTNLAKGLAMGLEFKMAAEILRTLLIENLEELYMLGAVILLRALLSLLIHYEIRPHKRAKKELRESEEAAKETDKASGSAEQKSDEP
ncbi:MAG: DUF1622 domain-containing protein [Clostridia bacterium]|nr:DUF1622 domain-containing protein [Clostridia bacterium]